MISEEDIFEAAVKFAENMFRNGNERVKDVPRLAATAAYDLVRELDNERRYHDICDRPRPSAAQEENDDTE